MLLQSTMRQIISDLSPTTYLFKIIDLWFPNYAPWCPGTPEQTHRHTARYFKLKKKRGKQHLSDTVQTTSSN